MIEPVILRRVAIFSGMSEPELVKIAAIASERTVPKGRAIFFEGDIGEVLYLIKSGRVKVFRMAQDGREKIYAVLGAGETLGEMALLDGGRRSASAEAIEDCRMIQIHRDRFLETLEQSPGIAIKIIESLCGRLRHANDQVEHLAFLDARGRVVSAILDLTSGPAARKREDSSVELAVTHQQLGQMAGTSRETTTRVLSELEQEGLIVTERNRLVVADVERLRSILPED